MDKPASFIGLIMAWLREEARMTQKVHLSLR
jgi:hypothetical protein